MAYYRKKRSWGQRAKTYTKVIYRKGRRPARRANNALSGNMGAAVMPVIASLITQDQKLQALGYSALGFMAKNHAAKIIGIQKLSEQFLVPAVKGMMSGKSLWSSNVNVSPSNIGPEETSSANSRYSAAVAQVKNLMDQARMSGDVEGVNQLLGYLAGESADLSGPADYNESFKI